MFSLPNLLSLTCILAVGGVAAVGHHTVQQSHRKQNVKAFLYGPNDVNGVTVTPVHGGSIRKVTAFGSADEQALAYAANRYHDIRAEAAMADPTPAAARPATVTRPTVQSERPLRSSDFHHLRTRQRAAALNAQTARPRTVFSRSRRAELLTGLGRSYPRAGASYVRTGRDNLPVSPTGRTTVFQRSRFHRTQSASKYSYSGYGKIRRVPRRIHR